MHLGLLLDPAGIPGSSGDDGLVRLLPDVFERQCTLWFTAPAALASTPKVQRVVDQIKLLMELAPPGLDGNRPPS